MSEEQTKKVSHIKSKELSPSKVTDPRSILFSKSYRSSYTSPTQICQEIISLINSTDEENGMDFAGLGTVDAEIVVGTARNGMDTPENGLDTPGNGMDKTGFGKVEAEIGVGNAVKFDKFNSGGDSAYKSLTDWQSLFVANQQQIQIVVDGTPIGSKTNNNTKVYHGKITYRR
eukprot:304704_1